MSTPIAGNSTPTSRDRPEAISGQVATAPIRGHAHRATSGRRAENWRAITHGAEHAGPSSPSARASRAAPPTRPPIATQKADRSVARSGLMGGGAGGRAPRGRRDNSGRPLGPSGSGVGEDLPIAPATIRSDSTARIGADSMTPTRPPTRASFGDVEAAPQSAEVSPWQARNEKTRPAIATKARAPPAPHGRTATGPSVAEGIAHTTAAPITTAGTTT